MRKRTLFVLAIVIALAVLFWPKTATQQIPSPTSPRAQPTPAVQAPPSLPDTTGSLPAFLPREARETVAAIQRGGPFPHRQDGSVFGNREGLLPSRQRGYYREYTVDTPGVDHRGARRIITGGAPAQTWYYTADHYDSFRAFDVRAPERQR